MAYLREPGTDSNSFLRIPGYPNHVISLDGKTVRNVKTGYDLSVSPNKTGSRCYLQCAIGRVHRLLMFALMGRELHRNEFVRHKNGNTYDNDPANLILGTARDNSADRIGTNTNGKTLRNQDVRDIRHFASRLSRKQLAHRYRITPGHVRDILSGRRWANLP